MISHIVMKGDFLEHNSPVKVERLTVLSSLRHTTHLVEIVDLDAIRTARLKSASIHSEG